MLYNLHFDFCKFTIHEVEYGKRKGSASNDIVQL